jgi:hypothetical protein
MESNVIQCLAMVKDGSGRCSKTRGAVLANGYCAQHQYVAIDHIMKQLKYAQTQLVALGKDPTMASKASLAMRQIEMLQEELRNARKVCDVDADCSHHLKDLLATLRDLELSGDTRSAPIRNLAEVERNVTDLTVGSPEDAEAFEVSKEYEVARRQRMENEAAIRKLQSELQDKSAQAEQYERSFQSSLSGLTSQLQSTQTQKSQADQIVTSLEKRIDKCQSESKQIAELAPSDTKLSSWSVLH